jgi:hypothetical protein
MLSKTLHYLLVFDFAVTDVVLTGPLGLAAFFFDFYEFACGCFALGAVLGSGVTFMYIAAYEASESLFHVNDLFNCY